MTVVQEPQLDTGQLVHEHKRLVAGIAALTQELHKAGDLGALEDLRWQIDQMLVDLRQAAAPVDTGCYWLERRRRDFTGVTAGPGGDGWWDG